MQSFRHAVPCHAMSLSLCYKYYGKENCGVCLNFEQLRVCVTLCYDSLVLIWKNKNYFIHNHRLSC